METLTQEQKNKVFTSAALLKNSSFNITAISVSYKYD